MCSPSLHICPHRLLVSIFYGHQASSVWSSFQIEINCFKKEYIRSFHLLILVLFSLIYERPHETIMKEID